MKKKLKDTKLGEWFRNKAPKAFEIIGDVVPGGDALKAIGALIDASTESEDEKEKARLLLSRIRERGSRQRKEPRDRNNEDPQQAGLDAVLCGYCCNGYRYRYGYLGEVRR
jgi:hypothetical protein